MAVSNLFNKSFLTRTISGVVLFLILLVTFIFGGYFIFGLTLILSMIGLNEIYKTVEIHNKALGVIGYLSVLAYYVLVYFKGTEYLGIFVVALLIVMMALYVFTFPKYKTEQIMLMYFGIFYVGLMLSYVYQTRMLEGGIYLVWMIFICSWVCDTCAYCVGMLIGKHKMSPKLSPKKSVEGAIGGVAGSMIFGGVYGAVCAEHLTLFQNPAISLIIIAFVGALISMVGDLAASAIKRNYEVKDYGTLIPGHGGILDRFDSVIFTAPVIYILSVLL